MGKKIEFLMENYEKKKCFIKTGHELGKWTNENHG